MADTPLIQHVPYSGSFTYTVDPGSTPRDVYFIFTNPSLSQNAAQLPGVSSVVSVDGFKLPAPASQPLPSYNSSPQSLTERIAEFNRNPSEYQPAAPIPGPSAGMVSGIPAQNDSPGVTTGTFSLDLSAVTTVNATCQAVVGPVAFADGRTRTLSIWVDNSDWNVAGEVNAAMLGDIASRFLKGPAESTSDIYHWDTSVVGEPWGPQPYSNLISWDSKNTVTILLTHLNSSYSGGVIVGYFWAKDNFTSASLPGSNQRIMFYIDSHLYASLTGSETGYSPTNYWPKIIFSTLAHEFQHMIQFYQKQVVRGATTGTDTWINEMCSMLIEDLVADDLGVEGPRGVSTGDAGSPGNTLGRIPYFNASSNFSLAVTGANFGLTDYALAYAFGAWLIRNYGGASLVQRIVQCPQTDSTAVVNAAAAYSGQGREHGTAPGEMVGLGAPLGFDKHTPRVSLQHRRMDRGRRGITDFQPGIDRLFQLQSAAHNIQQCRDHSHSPVLFLQHVFPRREGTSFAARFFCDSSDRGGHEHRSEMTAQRATVVR